jgi:hypothetical protein
MITQMLACDRLVCLDWNDGMNWLECVDACLAELYVVTGTNQRNKVTELYNDLSLPAGF